MNSSWEIAGLTDTGQVRAHNEDAVDWDSSLGFAVLADGVGGQKSGEVASDLAVGRIKTLLRHAFCAGPDGSPDLARRDHTSALAEVAVREANASILRAGTDRDECRGMATTVVLALFGTDHITVSHVGDSRLYRLRSDQLDQLTVDHSLAQEFVQTGYLSREQAQASAHRNIVTRALGVTKQVKVEVRQYETEPGDVYLLCSDGLSNPVSEPEIRCELLQAENDVPETVQRLVSLANQRGGEDNISVIVARHRA
jgi:protein phosphatase